MDIPVSDSRLDHAAEKIAVLLGQLVEEVKNVGFRLQEISDALQGTGPNTPRYILVGGGFMYIVKDTQDNVNYTIVPPTVLDARGRPVPGAQLTYEIASDSPAVVVTPDANDPLSGVAGPFNDNDDGTPATANINVAVKLQDGTLVGSFGAQFTVTAGDPASIKGGAINFAGLTEV